MARKGRFGRYRGNYGSMSALIAQLQREQRSAEDRAIVDAYNNGGLYQGKPVDDDRLLDHYRLRRGQITDHSDPMWNEWNNRVIQQKFSIGEQRIALRYKQGKASAAAVAAFYRRELEGLPKDSAWYREVAGRAAQWAGSATSAARGRARSRAVAGATQGKVDRIVRRQRGYLGLEGIIREAAVRAGLITERDPITKASATALRALFDAGIYGTGGDRITIEDWQEAAKDFYQTFNDRIRLNKQLNRGVIDLRDQRRRFKTEVLIGMRTLDDREAYETARAEFDEAYEGAYDPAAELAALRAYAADLRTIRANATDADPDFIGGLTNEIAILTTGKNTGKTVTDLWQPADYSGNDAQGMADAVTRATTASADIASGKAFLGQEHTGGVPVMQPRPPWGLGDEYAPTVTPTGGVIWLKGTPVSASVILDVDGRVVDPAALDPAALAEGLRTGTLEQREGNRAGFVFVNADGKQTYGVYDESGDLVFTDSDPFTGPLLPGANGGLTVFTGQSIPIGDGDATADVRSVVEDFSGSPVIIGDGPPLTTAAFDTLASRLGLSEDEYAAKRAKVEEAQAARSAAYMKDASKDDALLTGRVQGGSFGPPKVADRYYNDSPIGNAAAAIGRAVSDQLRPLMLPTGQRAFPDGLTPPPTVKSSPFLPPGKAKDDVYVPPKPSSAPPKPKKPKPYTPPGKRPPTPKKPKPKPNPYGAPGAYRPPPPPGGSTGKGGVKPV
jgi:hypothetical protein